MQQQVSGGKRKLTDFHVVRCRMPCSAEHMAKGVACCVAHHLETHGHPVLCLVCQAPILSTAAFFPELHAPTFAIRLLRDA